LIAIYFVYGLIFFGAGLLLAVQARLPTGVLPKRQLTWIALFAMTHGLCEWAKMEWLAAPSMDTGWSLVEPFLLVLSFVFLMQFGFDALIALARVPRWTKAVPTALLIVFVLVVALEGGPHGGTEAAARYLIGLPGSLLAALALVTIDHDRRKAADVPKGAHLTLAGAVFLVFGLVAGLVVPRAPFFPASWLNVEAFRAMTGMPVEVLRAVCAVLVAIVMTETLIIQSAKEHAELERLREESLSMIAHDLRSPIDAINLGALALQRLIERGNWADVDRAFRLLGNMKTNVNRLDRMVTDLFDTSRIDAHRLTIETEPVELGSLVRDVVTRAAAATTDHPVKTSVPESLPMVVADPARLEQVLVNLLSNAAKYSTPGSEIQLEAVARVGEVQLAVTNTGEGLAPEETTNLFTRFYRSQAHRGRAPGTGLGLYIAKSLVEAQGGRMWVESERGRYATFAFTLPTLSA